MTVHVEGCSCGAPDCPQWLADQQPARPDVAQDFSNALGFVLRRVAERTGRKPSEVAALFLKDIRHEATNENRDGIAAVLEVYRCELEDAGA